MGTLEKKRRRCGSLGFFLFAEFVEPRCIDIWGKTALSGYFFSSICGGLLVLNSLTMPDWYAKIKYDDGRTVYFAVFGTHYLYSAGKWLKGRFVRFSFNRGFDAFNVLNVFQADKTILVESVMDGYIVYQPSENDKIFIGSSVKDCIGLFDNREKISVLLENGVLMLDYDVENYVYNLLVCNHGICYIDMMSDEVYDQHEFGVRQCKFSSYSPCYLALRQPNGMFALYALTRKDSSGFKFAYRISGGDKVMFNTGGVYVADQGNFGLYRLEK